MGREDLDILAAWPRYPFPYEGFEFSFKTLNSAGRDQVFSDRQQRTDGLSLVIDHRKEAGIGYVSLIGIDWSEGRVGNFGFRIHPDWVDKGIGTTVLRIVCSWLFERGMASIGVDVAASNGRAVRCYQKVGFYKTGETWREAPDLKGVDTDAARYDFLRPHLRREGGLLMIRFTTMALRPADSQLSSQGRDWD